jgi:hypothetical protein
LQHRSRPLQHFVISEPQHRVAQRFEELRPLAIRVELPLVVITVDLNDEAPAEANEIHDVAPDGLLPLERVTRESVRA